MLIEFIEISSLIFSYIGAVMILYGGILATIKTLNLEIRRLPILEYHDIRRDFTHKIVFGLDFLIAGDILRTIIAPSQEEIILLGAIVGIRTILGYFLSKEVIEYD